jgi:hypothetical protein
MNLTRVTETIGKGLVALAIILWAIQLTNAQTATSLRESIEKAKAKPMKIDRGFLRPYGPATWISLGVCIAGATSDIISTGDMYETNRFMRNSEGKLDVKRAAFVSGLVCSGSFLIEKKWPKLAHLFRAGSGGLRFKSAIGNWKRNR